MVVNCIYLYILENAKRNDLNGDKLAQKLVYTSMAYSIPQFFAVYVISLRILEA